MQCFGYNTFNLDGSALSLLCDISWPDDRPLPCLASMPRDKLALEKIESVNVGVAACASVSINSPTTDVRCAKIQSFYVERSRFPAKSTKNPVGNRDFYAKIRIMWR